MSTLQKIAKAAQIEPTQITALFAGILEAVKNGERVVVMGFGSFKPGKQAGRTITSPKLPGGKTTIPERNVLRFKAAPQAKDALNEGSGHAKGTLPKAEAKPKAAEKPAAKQPAFKPAAVSAQVASVKPSPATPAPAAKTAPNAAAKPSNPPAKPAAAPTKPANQPASPAAKSPASVKPSTAPQSQPAKKPLAK